MMLAYQLFVLRPAWLQRLSSSSLGRAVAQILRAGWGADAMYDAVVVRPYRTLARWLRHEPVDDLLALLTGSVRVSHYVLVLTQSGRIRTYAVGMALGVILLLLSWLWR
jgi:NADH-quinone oxidoreductase subunit L